MPITSPGPYNCIEIGAKLLACKGAASFTPTLATAREGMAPSVSAFDSATAKPRRTQGKNW